MDQAVIGYEVVILCMFKEEGAVTKLIRNILNLVVLFAIKKPCTELLQVFLFLFDLFSCLVVVVRSNKSVVSPVVLRNL